MQISLSYRMCMFGECVFLDFLVCEPMFGFHFGTPRRANPCVVQNQADCRGNGVRVRQNQSTSACVPSHRFS